ncbi:MAG: ABC-2 family transporter protein, partial [Proteobacteria bacterium]|nr:ABC-2 family transporter protein [Pseudomonadota bacterium]
WRTLGCSIAGGCGFIVLFSIRFMFASVSAIFVKSDALSQIWYQLYKLATRPDVIYPSWIRIIIFTILPIGFISSIPSRLILDKVHIGVVFASIAAAASSLWLTSKWWTFVLSKYSSASS